MNLLSKSGLSLERLRTFLAFAEAGSIVRASANDPVRASLISRQLRELEEFFEVELVKRHGKGLVLTDEGMRLAALVREQFLSLEEFRKTATGKSIRLTLGAGNTMLEWVVVPRIKPGLIASVEFDLHHEQSNESIEGLRNGSRDLAIIQKKPLSRQFASASLGSVSFALFIPKRLGRQTNLRKALRELPLALPIGGSLREAILQYAGEINAANLGTTGFHNAVALVRAGHYAAVLPSIATVNIGPDISMSPIPPSVVQTRQIVLAWSKRAATTRPAIALAIEKLREVLVF